MEHVRRDTAWQEKAIAGEGVACWREPMRAPELRGDLLRHIDPTRDEQRFQIKNIHGLAFENEGGGRCFRLLFVPLPDAGC
jgi:hypothetical protein